MLISKHFLCRVVGTVKGQSTFSLHPHHFGYFQHAGHGGKETVERRRKRIERRQERWKRREEKQEKKYRRAAERRIQRRGLEDKRARRVSWSGWRTKGTQMGREWRRGFWRMGGPFRGSLFQERLAEANSHQSANPLIFSKKDTGHILQIVMP